VVESCGLTKPDVGEQFWRIPAEMSAKGLQVTMLLMPIKNKGYSKNM
jgi:hypothetical protein